MTTPDPTEYLIARCAEDEAAALAAIHHGASGVWARSTSLSDECRVEGDDITIYDEGGHDAAKAEHIARHDPARVLADVAAKRAVVDIHCTTDMSWTGRHVELGCPQCHAAFEGGLPPHPCPTLRALLQPYADRPDFPDEWRTT